MCILLVVFPLLYLMMRRKGEAQTAIQKRICGCLLPTNGLFCSCFNPPVFSVVDWSQTEDSQLLFSSMISKVCLERFEISDIIVS